MYTKVCLTMLFLSFLQVASAQTADNPSTNYDPESNTKEIELKELDVLGVFDRTRFKTENVAIEIVNQPKAKTLSSVDFLSPRSQWPFEGFAIKEKEASIALVYKIPTLKLRYFRAENEDSLIRLTDGTSSCHPLEIKPPKLVGGMVETFFVATCRHTGTGPHDWEVTVTLVPPGLPARQSPTPLTGPTVTFNRGNTLLTYACKTGMWESKAELTYNQALIYTNSRFKKINSCNGD